MDIKLHKSVLKAIEPVQIPGSKSETNRLLLLQAQFPNLILKNISGSDDSEAMAEGLRSTASTINIGHAGTAMRFLTAWFAIQQNRVVVLDGSQRMRQRPIAVLVNALRQLGAEIEYVDQEGFPPLRISGSAISNKSVTLNANVSSQYISALLLIAPSLKNGLRLTLQGSITSRPYIEMTLRLLNKLGVATSFKEQQIIVEPRSPEQRSLRSFIIESDWSAASYYYSMIALSPIGTSLKLQSFARGSLQGDSVLSSIYQLFGVSTRYDSRSIVLTKERPHLHNIDLDLNASPDLAQTIAATCLGLGCGCRLSGLHTLKVKETDRLHALNVEMQKLGGAVSVTNDALELMTGAVLREDVHISTYGDHRMAMAFAPLALKVPIYICDGGVVTKSYPQFWKHLADVNFRYEE